MQALPQLDAFPYLLTRLVPTLYHVLLVPEGMAPAEAAAAARQQAAANRLPTCLAFQPDEALYLDADGTETWTDAAPRGGNLVAGRLRPCAALAPAAGEAARVARLDAYVAAHRRGGYLLGDLRKGGRPASAAERGAPRGRGAGRGPARAGALRGVRRVGRGVPRPQPAPAGPGRARPLPLRERHPLRRLRPAAPRARGQRQLLQPRGRPGLARAGVLRAEPPVRLSGQRRGPRARAAAGVWENAAGIVDRERTP